MAAQDSHDEMVSIPKSSFLAQLGTEIVSQTGRQVVIRQKIDNRHLRSRGIAHGGVIATLLDSAMGIAVSNEVPPNTFPVTAQLDVKFVRPAWDGELLVATGEVCHKGRQTAVARGELRTTDDVLVAVASGTFFYVEDPAPDAELLPRSPD